MNDQGGILDRVTPTTGEQEGRAGITLAVRPWTASSKNWVTGRTRLTVKRCCNGCQRELGDVREGELVAAITGAPLPDVTDECGCKA